jgi:thiamine-monophosphate kinase
VKSFRLGWCSPVTEASILDWLKTQPATLGLGDDCYVLSGTFEDLVFTTDMYIEDVHCRRDQNPELLGHNTLARGLSDIAAMGAEPRFCLLSLAVPEWADEAWVQRFYGGLLKLSSQHGCVLTGGDISHTELLTADITVCGATPHGQALRRDTAKAGHGIYVSDPLGARARDRFANPIRPRLDLVEAIRGRASSCMDLSDGLSTDLRRLCLASGVSATLDAIPIASGATEEQALHAGEDYELLITSPTPIGDFFRIGTVRAGAPGVITFKGETLVARGYDHFKQEDGSP